MKVILVWRRKLLRRLTDFFRAPKGGRVPVPEVGGSPTGETPAAEAVQARPEPSPTKERGAVVPKKLAVRHIIIGVDFGTSRTKVIWQDLSDSHFETVRWRPDRDGLGQWLLPSTVLLRNGTICFGVPETEGERDGLCLRFLKLCLLCRRNPPACRCGNPGAQGGNIRLSESDYEFPASAFAGLFLAYVFREVERRLLERFPGDNLVLLWNIGCPMDYTNADGYRCDWEKMAGVAVELRMQVSAVVNMSFLAECARRLEAFEVPPPEERNYFVQPEALAAVKAFLESPDAEMKTYAIVDVGAGTTEVSFFFNGRAMDEPGQPFRPSYLADSTEAVGGVKIDQELAEEWSCSVEEARKRKEREPSSVPLVTSMKAIREQYHRTCAKIAKNHIIAGPDDKHFDLFIIGGGSKLKPLQVQLQDHDLPGGFTRDRTQELYPPRKMNDRLSLESDYHFLAVACGLASSLDWKYYPSVYPIPKEPPGHKVDQDELYPK